MNAIGPGDWVECVKDSESAPGTFVVGALYLVDRIHPGPFPNGYPGLGLFIRNVPTSNPYGWVSDLFRPVYHPRADLIERLLAPVPKVLEPVSGRSSATSPQTVNSSPGCTTPSPGEEKPGG